MNFGFSEDQDLIRKSARDFVQGESSLVRIRELREDALGHSPEVWRKIAGNGWCGAIIPEEFGGVGLGCVDITCILEEFGKGLMPEPLVTSGVLAASAILHGATDEQKQSLLPGIADGSVVATLAAYEDKGRYDFTHVETKADKAGNGYALTGSKALVADAAAADVILVTARTAAGVGLFAVKKGAAGLVLTPVSTMDRRRRYTLTLTKCEATLIGAEGKALPAVEAAIDRACVAQAAEQVGGMEEALRRTLEYLHQRVQFGRAIGSFQALKHKAANMYVELEMARSSLYYAAMALDQGMADKKSAVSSAKALCSDGYIAVTKEAIQLHGGIGFTDEHDIHFFYKRAIVSSVTFGDGAHHRDRFAAENGFGKGAA